MLESGSFFNFYFKDTSFCQGSSKDQRTETDDSSKILFLLVMVILTMKRFIQLPLHVDLINVLQKSGLV